MASKTDCILIDNLIRKSSYIEKCESTTYQLMNNFDVNHIPDIPESLLPNNFTVSGVIDDIKLTIEKTLPSKNGNSFTSSKTTWSGMWVDEYSNSCTFKIRIYKSKKNPNQYIIEGDRTGGEIFPFRYFFSYLKWKLIKKMM